MEGKNNMTWKGTGFCRSRSIYAENDYCNKPTVENGDYCQLCTCSVQGCKETAVVTFPLLIPEVRLCSRHIKGPTSKYKRLVEQYKCRY